MVALRTSLGALLLVLGACDVGEVPSGGGGGTPDAGAGGGIVATEAGFIMNVAPIMAQKGCMPGGAACHGGTNMPNLTSFAMVDVKYKTKPGMNNILVTKWTISPRHSNIDDYSTEQKAAIANWIDGK